MSVFASLCHDMPMAEIEDAPSASLLRLPCDSDMLRPQQGFNKVITYLASLAMVYTHTAAFQAYLEYLSTEYGPKMNFP